MNSFSNKSHKCIFGLAGFSNSGKTTLALSLIKVFRKKGYSLGTIKHAHHNFDIDKPGKDSWKHREAGSQEIIVSSSKRIAHIIEHDNDQDTNLSELISLQKNKDIILVEGFKKEKIPKIEVWRENENREIISLYDKNIFAIATDNIENKELIKLEKKILDLNKPKLIADFIINYFDLKKGNLQNTIKVSGTSFDEARKLIINKVKPKINEEYLKINRCNSRVLLSNIISNINLPQTNNSAVDGYGFNYKNYNNKNGSKFKISDVIKAGLQKKFRVDPKNAVRIFTGAAVPEPVDTIVMQEDCSEKNGIVEIPSNIRKGINLRPLGENLKKNQLVIKRGKFLDSTDLGLATSLGFEKLKVNKKLRIGIVSTGNEIISAGKSLKNGLVYDSNGPMIFDLCLNTGNQPYLNKIVKDNAKSLRTTLSRLLKTRDLIIFSGGASEGEEDHIRSVVNELNGKIHFWRISIKPGRPMGFATIEDIPIFCLPGNPVAAQVCFKLLVECGILKRMSASVNEIIKVQAISNFNQKCKFGRKEFLRGKLIYRNHSIIAEINGKPGAGVLTSLSGAHGLIEVDENTDIIKKGDIVNFIPFKEALI